MDVIGLESLVSKCWFLPFFFLKITNFEIAKKLKFLPEEFFFLTGDRFLIIFVAIIGLDIMYNHKAQQSMGVECIKSSSI